MDLNHVDGLLLSSLTLSYKGQAIYIDKLVIDTGASHSLISVDVVSDIGVYFENTDEIVNAFGIGGEALCFRKTFDTVQLGTFQIQNFKLDVGLLHQKLDINGLIGLDLLMQADMILDLSQLAMYPASIKS
ncbi:retropepsin-like aspartic protease [Paenibacillus thiaminolyticus]|uniref:retropepsin-like aspartic protease n=1 Tax=Paenibacillus thiaminolyticus TaxID=49283 RepID=UPI00240BE3F7|nr:retropepsin-like domain-containing protein [Paenibacillus thiaminolyticus]